MSGILSNVAGDYPDYLRDESRRVGTADGIAFPRDEAEVLAILAEARGRGVCVTVQGARTGITGGAVPDGGWILNTSRMNRILGLRQVPETGRFTVTVQPGLTLTALREALAAKSFDTAEWAPEAVATLARFRMEGAVWFPPDPTEPSASIGGMVACNASGACTFHYGPTRQYIRRLRLALPDGEVLDLERGVVRCGGRAFQVRSLSGRVYAGRLPSYTLPAVKNAAGYHAADDMDLVDLFIGAEGTLGVITEVELCLLPEPPARLGVMTFFGDEAAAVRFVRAVREPAHRAPAAGANLTAVEFFDSHALELLRERKRDTPAFAEVPELPPSYHTAVYVEYHGPGSEILDTAVADMAGVMAGAGGNPDHTWLADSPREIERLKAFRHALPEAVNLTLDERRRREPGLTKLGTDMAVPDEHLEAVMALYHHRLDSADVDHVIFGHIGNNHLHVNIIPSTLHEYALGKTLYAGWAQEVIRMGGTISAEHGVGKFKVMLLQAMYGARGMAEMRAVKQVFDPAGRLNPGNLF